MRYLILVCSLLVFLPSCSSTQQSVPNLSVQRNFAENEKNDPSHFKIFFDGTSNDYRARTNVRRRFEMTATAEDPHYPCLYVEGVGVRTLSGKALGFGMKERVISAYCYLARHWNADHKDTLQIYGFSRGAFQARMLAGLLAHCGLPNARDRSETDVKALAERIWEYCEEELSEPVVKAKTDSEKRAGIWHKHLAENRQSVIRFANATRKPNQPEWKFSNPEVTLLGIWDTVPGLPMDKIVEDTAIVDRKKRPYKISPYPNTKYIIHALALDEKRSQFHPLRIGPPIDPNTKVYEVWFPGVHSDVGGGYSDSNDMAGISMAWMQQIMRKKGLIAKEHTFYSDAHGILHHPENVFFNSIGSKKISRQLRFGDHVDYSVFKRADQKEYPEQGLNGLENRKYVPEFTVIQGDGRTTKVLRLDQGPYDEKKARTALQLVGLDLYNAETNLENRPDGEPLTPLEMNIKVTSTSSTSETAVPAENATHPKAVR